jgi:hypothetical protein
MLVSEQPMVPEVVKTEASDRKVMDNFVRGVLRLGSRRRG